MKTYTTCDGTYGNLLWMTNGTVEAAAALDYGLRIMVLRCVGMENVLYCQPDDCSDGITAPQGWRLHGGHRFWASPESDDSYYPDNEPITYAIDGETVLLTQKNDPWTGFAKQFRMSFEDDGSLAVEHILTNVGTKPVKAAAWGITTLRSGGKARIPLAGSGDGYAPTRSVALWFDSSLGDERLSFEKDAIVGRHLPLENKLKLGAYTPQGSISAMIAGQKLEISFAVHPMENCPDHGSNVELFLNRYIMELETLGECREIMPGASVKHTEYWRISPFQE